MSRVLFTGNTLSQKAMDDLTTRGIEIVSGRTDYTENELIETLQGCDGYIIGGDEIATKAVIDQVASLKGIVFLGTGYENFVDAQAATAQGIAVMNTPHANAYTVAEFTLSLMLDTVKNLTHMNNCTRAGKWEKLQSRNVRGSTVGIVGMGTIGKYVAHLLHEGFGAKILYMSRTSKTDIETLLGAQRVDLATLLQTSDIVSLHLPSTKETIGLLSEAELHLMKPEAILINTARADLVNGHALYKALESEHIAAAAFDGYYVEPVPQLDTYRLLSLPNHRFLITPHAAYNSKEALSMMENMALDSMMALFEGREPDNLVNPDYRLARETQDAIR